MTTEQTTDLLREVQALIRERERDGVRGPGRPRRPVRVGRPRAPARAERGRASSSSGCPTRRSPEILEELSPGRRGPDPAHAQPGRGGRAARGDGPRRRRGRRRAAARGEADEILVRMRPEEASELRELSQYPPETAGGIMTPAFVAVPADATARRGDRARSGSWSTRPRRSTTSTSSAPDRTLLGVLSLYRLLLSPADTPVRELMAPSTVRVRADADREVAARLLTDRNLLALPVVDDADHLLGIITEDDVADVLEAEATEDIERLGGSEPLNAPYRCSGVAAARPQARRLAAAAVRRRGLHGHGAARLPGRAAARSSP